MTDDDQRLDALLDAFVVEPPSAALRQRVLAHAPLPRAGRGWFATRALWLSGAGLAAACAFGVIVGVSLGDSAAKTGLTDAETAAFGTATAFGAPVEADQKG